MEHIVEYAHTAHGAGHSRSFKTHKEAVEFAETRGGFRCVWLAEWAEYQTGGGKWRTGFVYSWWSPAVAEATEWGEPPKTDYGRPAGRKYHVPYRPYRYKSAKYAHLNVRATPVPEPDETRSSG